MITMKIEIENKNSPMPQLTTEYYYLGINEKNYEEEILKLLFWLKERKKQITYIEYKNG